MHPPAKCAVLASDAAERACWQAGRMRTPARLSCTRTDVLLAAAACAAFPGRLLAATTTQPFVTNLAATTDPALRELLARLEADQPKQQSSLIFPGDVRTSGLGRTDSLSFPPWMEGRWAVTSRPLSIAAPLGRRFLPADLARVRLGDLSELSVPPLQYEVSFVRRATDGAIVSDRINNLRAVQDAAAGFARVETASFDEKASKISVTCAPPLELSRTATCPWGSVMTGEWHAVHVRCIHAPPALKSDASA